MYCHGAHQMFTGNPYTEELAALLFATGGLPPAWVPVASGLMTTAAALPWDPTAAVPPLLPPTSLPPPPATKPPPLISLHNSNNTSKPASTTTDESPAPPKRSPKRDAAIWHNRPQTHVSALYPEILSMIFSYLDVPGKGRASQVCRTWKESCYQRSVWRGVEAKLHLKKSAQANTMVLQSIARRGIRRIQILSLQRTLKDLAAKELRELHMDSLVLTGCFGLTDDRLMPAFAPDVPVLHRELTSLNLSMCKNITDRSLARITDYLSGLESLDLGGCSSLTDSSLSAICKLHRLRRLNLRSCKNITDQGIARLCGQDQHPVAAAAGNDDAELRLQKQQAAGSPEDGSGGGQEDPTAASSSSGGSVGLQHSLESLVLQDCQKLTDDSLKHISVGLRNVKSINLSFCANVFEYGLKSLSTMPQLEELNLRSCDNVTDLALRYLGEGACQLRLLDISFCDKVGDPGLAYVAQGMPQLRHISLDTCSVTDQALINLAQSLPDLRILNIGQCTRITDKALSAVAEHCANLQSIDLYGCSQITTVGIKEIIDHLPNLNSYNLSL